MTKTEFINGLNFEVAKNSIARKLGMKASELSIKPARSGDFRIDIKNASGTIGSLVSGARKAFITTKDLKVTSKDGSFSYSADIDIDLKNKSGEFINTIGKIDLDKNKFVFITLDECNKEETLDA